MTARKWQIVEGRVYKLSEIFDNCIEALHHTRLVNRECHAVLMKTGENEWAVYFRPKEEIQCESKHYSVEEASSESPSQMNK